MHEDWGERCRRWSGVRSEWLDVDGMQVHVLRAEGPGDGEPQLLVHGLGGCASNWVEVIRELAAHGPVVAPDLPGFGRTQPDDAGRVCVVDSAQFLVRLLDELEWEHATVHGNSMGGMLALHLAGLAPQRVTQLVLVAPALPVPRTALHRIAPSTIVRFAPLAVPGLGPLLIRLVSRMSPERYWVQTARYLHGDPARVADEASDVGFEDLVFGRQMPWRPRALAAAAESVVKALLVPGELDRRIDEVDAPVLVVWGDADQVVSRVGIDHALARQPDWDLHVLPEVGHVPMLEAPRDYVDAVSDWMSSDDHGALLAA